MKKLFFLITSMFLLNSCAETFALLGPASSAFGGGNVVQSSVSSAVTYGIKKQTGKSPMEHALAYAEEKNPKKEKKRCISFIEKTNSEACAIVKKQVVHTQTKIKKKTKDVLRKISSKKKKAITEKKFKTTITPRGQAFAEARKKGEDSFVFNGKIYNTEFKSSAKDKKSEPKYSLFVKKINKSVIKTKKSAIELALDVQTALNKKSEINYLD